MIKPLLRTIPTLSGNVKLACTLLDYNKLNANTFETNIRGAHIYPISSQLFQKSVEANLLSSSWEFDLKRFYEAYSDIFHNHCFDVITKNMILLNKTETLYPRNTDFEYGVKRISYSKSGNQYACFAPMYIDNVDDIPSYFKLECKFFNGSKTLTKNIIVNIGKNGKSNENYIYKYLYKYVSKIDNDVCFINNYDKSVSYYGIDLVNGGFTVKSDTTINKIFDIKLPIQQVDYTITEGFKRNKLCMKQIIPIAFYFNVLDLLTSNEKNLFTYSPVVFSGAYYNSSDEPLAWFDFDWNYDNHVEEILQMNYQNGEMLYTSGFVNNIMDVSTPEAFNDRYLTQYQHANRLTTIFNRWKLKYSSDEHPYIFNLSQAFSKNQNSSYAYGNFPAVKSNMTGFAILNEETKYNLIFPLDTNVKSYNEINKYSANEYKNILNSYCVNWFSVIKNPYNIINEFNTITWSDVDNGYTYNRGILYNLNNAFNNISDSVRKIDKFAFLVYPETQDIKDEDAYNNDALFVSNIVTDKYSDKTNFLNCTISNVTATNVNSLYNINNTVKNANVSFDNIFTEISRDKLSEYDKAIYVNPYDLGKNYYDINSVNIISNIPTVDKLNTFTKQLCGIHDTKPMMNTVGALVSTLKNSIEDLGITHADLTNICKVFVYHVKSFGVNINDIDNSNSIPAIFKIHNNGVRLFRQIPIYRGLAWINSNGILNENIFNEKLDDSNIYFQFLNESFNPIPLHNIAVEEYEDDIQTSINDEYKSDEQPTIEHTDNGDIEWWKLNTKGKKVIKYTDWGGASKNKYLKPYKQIECADVGNDSLIRCTDYNDLITTFIYNKQVLKNGKSYDYWINVDYKDYYNDYYDETGKLKEHYTENDLSNIDGVVAIYTEDIISRTVVRVINKRHYQLGIEGIPDFGNLLTKPYGIMLYVKDTFVNTSLYDSSLASNVLTENIMYEFCNDVLNYTTYPLADINVVGTSTYNLFESVKSVYKDILNKCLNAVNNKKGGYLYYPILNYNRQPIGTDIVKDKLEVFDTILENNIKNNDIGKNYLYVYPYNISAICNAAGINTSTLTTFTTYGKVVNLSHLLAICGIADGEIYGNVPVYYKQYKVLTTNLEVKYKYVYIGNRNAVLDKIANQYIDNNIDENYIYYDSDKDMFYSIKFADVNKTTYTTEYFNIVVKAKYVQINQKLWDNYMNVNDGVDLVPDEKCKIPQYKDMFVYRTLTPIEYDIKYLQNTVVNTPEEGDLLEDQDTMLYPCFKEAYVEEKMFTIIYKDWSLSNIREVNIPNDKRYRYNENDVALLVSVTKDDIIKTNIPNSVKVYRKLFDKPHTEYINNINGGILNSEYSKVNLNVFEHNGLLYGCYILKVNFNNSFNMINALGLLDTNEKSDNIDNIDINNQVKFLLYINNVNIINNPNYIKTIFKQLCPFLNINLLNDTNKINTIIVPHTFNLRSLYSLKQSNVIDAKEQSLLYDKETFNSGKISPVQRYTHNITPYIKRTDVFTTLYRYKYKTINSTLLDTGENNSLGDFSVESPNGIHQIDYMMPLNIYSTVTGVSVQKSYNNIVDTFMPTEYKYYNGSKMINLEPEILIESPSTYTYEQLLEAENTENTFNVFSNYIKLFMDVNDDKLLFLYKKYKALYNVDKIGTTLNKQQNIYKLTYKFKLL